MRKPLPTSTLLKQPGVHAELPAAVALFRAITEQIPNAAVFVVDQNFRYLLAGGEALHTAGMQPSDFEGKYLATVTPEHQLNQYLADYTAIFAGETFVREHSVGQRFYRTRGRLIKGTNGMHDVAVAISYDITDERLVLTVDQPHL